MADNALAIRPQDAPATQDLTVIPKDIALRVFTTPGEIQPWLDHVRKEIDAFTPDVTTLRGRREIKSFAYKVTKSKTYLDGVGKELVAELKDIPKKIDATRKHVRDTLEVWAADVIKPLTDWEAADEARVAKHRSAIAVFATLSTDVANLTTPQLRESLAIIEEQPIDAETCEEFLADYQRARDAAALILNALIPVREKAEADAAELIQLRAAAKAREERDAFEADMLEKAAAERARAEAAAAQKIEDDRLAAEREVQREAERVEREARLVAEAEQRVLREAAEAKAREEAETAKRERDTEHRRAVNKAAVSAFIEHGFDETQAKTIVQLVITKAIPAVSIAY